MAGMLIARRLFVLLKESNYVLRSVSYVEIDFLSPHCPHCRARTILLAEVDLGLVFFSALQGLHHLLGHMLAGVSPVQEAAAAVLLHHLSSREACQFTEAIWAVDDGVAAVALGITQQEVTVC